MSQVSSVEIVGIVVGVFAGVVVIVVGGTVVGRRKGYAGLGGQTIVRCKGGHLFTTVWIPGVSLKALRWGWLRFQRCPVGNHWTWVTPVDVAELTDDEKRFAAAHRDTRLP